MLIAALRGVVERFGLRGQRVDDVAAGAVMKHSSQWNLTRESVLGCGSRGGNAGAGLATRLRNEPRGGDLVGKQDRVGQIDCAIAARRRHGERSARGLSPSFQQLLLRSYRGKSAIARIKPWFGVRPRNFRPVLPGITEPRTGLSMGESTELMVKTWGITPCRTRSTGPGKPPKGRGRLRPRILQGLGHRISRIDQGQQYPHRLDA